MEELAGWIAPAATMIAAMMTAANLGARFTGWGFVVFLVGAIAWVIVGWTSDQQNLLLSNAFLAVVNVVGIWRWLGRKARFDDAAEAAERQSEEADGDDLFAASKFDGMEVVGRDGAVIAHVVDALAQCRGGKITYLLVREGGVVGVGETIRQLGWDKVRVHGKRIETGLDSASLATLPLADAA
ncbi:PRC-barrel domain-containing protein [Sphingomonas jatrophae]|uniref:PRC-barrel domain-containing protein n=1 Tax=Sphingomonas jatrophae TaxID=1166337 RepID=A0A1I6JKV7_9SPHN|nr:PRC-barrel domain-containing protein [Sphingomonas jatrophae]SFR79612.1 PRC-barrel domain-containing protein [Sphingomonas jatrophae]